MTTLKVLKINGSTITISKQGGNIYIKSIKKIPLKIFKEEMSAQDIINLA